MQPHQMRVVAEKGDLDDKRSKLAAFINGKLFQTLDGAEQSRLKLQLEIMAHYSSVLGERIDAFN